MLVRHLTGDPPGQARAATRMLARTARLLLTDVVFAETIYVLSSYYELDRARVAELMRAVIAFPAISVLDPQLLLRALELHETASLAFADAYLVASAEVSGVGAVASFDRALDRLSSVRRLEPA